MIRLTQISVAPILGIVCACTAYQPAPIDTQHSAEQFAARRLDDPQLQAGVTELLPAAKMSWPPQQWDRAQLLAVAVLRNPQLAVTRSQVQAALAREVTAKEWVNPDMTLQSEYGARGEPHPWLYGVAFDYVLQSPARRRLEQEIARLDTINARLQLMEDIWTLRHELIKALSDWENAKRRLALLDQLATVQNRMLELEHKRIDAGEDSLAELALIEQGRIDTEQQQVQTQATAGAAQAAASKVLGLPSEALDGIQLAWPEWGSPPPIDDGDSRNLRDRALRSRADLAAAVGDYSIAEARFRLAVKRQYPELTIGPGYYWDHGINKFPLDIGMTLPLNGNRGEIAEARAAREVAGARMLAVQADILNQWASARRAEALAHSGADTAIQRVDSVRRQGARLEVGLRFGESDVFQLVETNMLAIRAELERLEMQAQWQTARNEFEDAVHSPVSGPETALAKSRGLQQGGAGS